MRALPAPKLFMTIAPPADGQTFRMGPGNERPGGVIPPALEPATTCPLCPACPRSRFGPGMPGSKPLLVVVVGRGGGPGGGALLLRVLPPPGRVPDLEM